MDLLNELVLTLDHFVGIERTTLLNNNSLPLEGVGLQEEGEGAAIILRVHNLFLLICEEKAIVLQPRLKKSSRETRTPNQSGEQMAVGVEGIST